MLVRLEEDLPYGLVIRAIFLRKHESVTSFTAGGGFKPAQESPWEPFIASTGPSSPGVVEKTTVTGRQQAH